MRERQLKKFEFPREIVTYFGTGKLSRMSRPMGAGSANVAMNCHKEAMADCGTVGLSAKRLKNIVVANLFGTRRQSRPANRSINQFIDLPPASTVG